MNTNFVMNGNVAQYVKDTNAAIIFSNIYYWCLENKTKGVNCHKDNEGNERYWTFDTIKTLTEKFFFLTERQIRTSLEKLETNKLIITGSFNKLAYDRTKWYTVTKEGEALIKSDKNQKYLYDENDKWKCQKCQMEVSEMSNGSDKNDKPIPHNNTNIDTNIDSHNSHSEPTPFDDDTLGSEDSLSVSSSSPSPFDDEPVSQPVASTHSDKPNEEQKPRRSAKGSYPNEYYKTVRNTYMSNYKTLLDTGKLKTPLPNIAIMSVKGTLKKYFDAYGYETILKAVKESVNDDWLIEHGYVFHHIFGERKLLMLINGIKYENKKTVVTNSLVKQSLESDYDGEW